MSTAAIGIDLTGIQDSASALDGEATSLNPSPKTTIPPVVIAGVKHFDQPLTGESALWAIEGRGWTWPEEARPPQGEFCSRIPVLSMLNTLCLKKSSLHIDGSGGDVQIPRLMGHHLKYLCDTAVNHSQPGNHCLLAATVPDDWDETTQSLMLDCLRETRLSDFDLLWRPVAMALAWGELLTPEAIRNISGTALVVGFGPSTMEASILWLENRESAAGYLLTPVRRQAGKTYKSGVAAFAQQCAQDMARLHNSDTLAWQTLWGSDYLWGKLLRHKPELKVFQDDKGEWIYLEEEYKPSELDIWNILKGDLLATFQMLDRSQIVEAKTIIASSVLQALCPIGLNLIDLFKTTFEELGYKPRFLEDTENTLSASQFSIVDPSRGAAMYGWRRMKDLPTYYDFLPQIEINALTTNGTEFIPLVPRQDTIEGGTRFGPHEVEQRFKLPAGAEEIRFFIAKENEEEVRKTITRFKSPPSKDTVVRLLVTQRPGQGHAKVEIIPIDKNTPLGQGTVTLDWKSLEPTGETKEAVLKQLQAEQKLGYPAHGPRKTGLSAWERKNVWKDLIRYLATEPPRWGADSTYRIALRKVKLRLSSKRKLVNTPGTEGPEDYIWMISSNGEVPRGSVDQLQLDDITESFESCEELFQKVREKATNEFLTYVAKSREYKRHQYNKSFAALCDVLSWCYSSAPPELCDTLLTAMTEKTGNGPAVRAAGRCFACDEHVSKLADIVSKYYQEEFVPMHWLRALADVFLLRDSAPLLMTNMQAGRLVILCLGILKQQTIKGNFKTKFLSALLLLMLLLRYRIKDSDFLSLESAQWGKLRNAVNIFLRNALNALPTSAAYEKQRNYINEFMLMLDYQGGNQLIAVELGYDPDLESNKEEAEDGQPPIGLEAEPEINLGGLKKNRDQRPFITSTEDLEAETHNFDILPQEAEKLPAPSTQEPAPATPTERELTGPQTTKQKVIRLVEQLLRFTKCTKTEIQQRVVEIYGPEDQISIDEISDVLNRLLAGGQKSDLEANLTRPISSYARQDKPEGVHKSSASVADIENFITDLLKDGFLTNSQIRSMVSQEFGDLEGISYSVDDVRTRIARRPKEPKQSWRGEPSTPASRDRVIKFVEELFRVSDTSLIAARKAIQKEFGSHCNISYPQLRSVRSRVLRESNDASKDSVDDQKLEAETAQTKNDSVKSPEPSSVSSQSHELETSFSLRKTLHEDAIASAEDLFRKGTHPLEANTLLREQYGVYYDLTFTDLRMIHARTQEEIKVGSPEATKSVDAHFSTVDSGQEPPPQTEVPATSQRVGTPEDGETPFEERAGREDIVRFVEGVFRKGDLSSVEIKRLLKDKFGSKHYLSYPQIDSIRRRIRGKKPRSSPHGSSKIPSQQETSLASFEKPEQAKRKQVPEPTEKLANVLLRLIGEATEPVSLYDFYPKIARMLGLPETSYRPPFKSDSLINTVPKVALSLLHEGFLTKPAFGLWRITPEGKEELRRRSASAEPAPEERTLTSYKSLYDKMTDSEKLSEIILMCASEVRSESQLFDLYPQICEKLGSTSVGIKNAHLSEELANNIQTCIFLLSRQGYIQRSRPGYWKVTEAGRAALGRNKSS